MNALSLLSTPICLGCSLAAAKKVAWGELCEVRDHSRTSESEWRLRDGERREALAESFVRR